MTSFTERLARWKLKRTPLVKALREHTKKSFQENSGLAEFDQDIKDNIINSFFEMVMSIYSSSSPLLACRKEVTAYTLFYARLKIKTLTKRDKFNSSFFLNPYISGELCTNIRQSIIVDSKSLEFIALDSNLSDEELISIINVRSNVFLYVLNGLNYIRIDLNDCLKKSKDWGRFFQEAMLVTEEHYLREKLGLPLLLNEPLGALPYSVFRHYVLNGEPDPYVSWRRDHPDVYLAGEGSAPNRAID